jgi:N-methylhydantoinase B
VEIIEVSMPALVERYGLVPDSGGPGRYRGGCGITRAFRILRDNVSVVVLGDRVQNPPWGLAGGGPARTARYYVVRPDGSRIDLPSKTHITLGRDDLLVLETPGGGGWGDPRQRPREAVLADVAAGLVSPAAALSQYGVKID